MEYNLLEEGKDDKMILEWEQDSDMYYIISEARHMIQTGELSEIESVVKLMKRQENQHSAPVIASIATLLGYSIVTRNLGVKQSVSTGLANIILWDVKLITSKDTWPTRRHLVYKGGIIKMRIFGANSGKRNKKITKSCLPKKFLI